MDYVINLMESAAAKSCDLVIFPVKFLKSLTSTLAPFLTELFNSSLSSGQFPDDFKEVIVRPLEETWTR